MADYIKKHEEKDFRIAHFGKYVLVGKKKMEGKTMVDDPGKWAMPGRWFATTAELKVLAKQRNVTFVPYG